MIRRRAGKRSPRLRTIGARTGRACLVRCQPVQTYGPHLRLLASLPLHARVIALDNHYKLMAGATIVHQLLEYWRDVLRNDLAGFADPGTLVEIALSGRDLLAKWQLRNRQFEEAFFVDNSGDFRWHDKRGDGHRTYPEFLSSAKMADFDHLSYAIGRRFPLFDHYVPTKAQISNGIPTDATEYSDQMLLDTVDKFLSLRSGKTQLIFVKGDAGAGKTTLLERITSLQSSRYRASPTNQYIFLYVSAQGRALSNLKDALAAETGDLRATFTWDAIAPLTRRGLLVPIIDGFDELLVH